MGKKFAPKHPVQPLVTDEHGVIRFKENQIVSHLLDRDPNYTLNNLARMDFSPDDWQQFAQLIGYSRSGYGELPYVDDAQWERVEQATNVEGGRLTADDFEKAYIQGRNQAWHRILQLILDGLGEEGSAERWRLERAEVVSRLRSIYRAYEFVDDWPDDAHLGDVLENLHDELEERLGKEE